MPSSAPHWWTAVPTAASCGWWAEREPPHDLFDAGYPAVALGGTGRLADELAHARNSERPTVETLRTSALLHPVDTTMPGGLASVLRRLLGRTR